HQDQPDNPTVALGLAQCRYQRGEPVAALAILDEAISRHAEEFPLLLERGRLAMQVESPAQAEQWLRRAVLRAPYDYNAVFTLYTCLQQAGKRAEAEALRPKLKEIENDLELMNDL